MVAADVAVGVGVVGAAGVVAGGAALVAATENNPSVQKWRAEQRGKLAPPPEGAFGRSYYPAGSIPLDLPCTNIHVGTVPE